MSDGHKRGEPSFYGYRLVRAVLETGCARLQKNPKNRPTSLSHGQAGYLGPFTGWIYRCTNRQEFIPSVYAASSVLKPGRKGVVPETGLDTLQPIDTNASNRRFAKDSVSFAQSLTSVSKAFFQNPRGLADNTDESRIATAASARMSSKLTL